MTYKEAKEYLLPIAANCVLPQYALALEKAVEALEKVEALDEQDGMIDRLLEDLLSSTDRCKFCEQSTRPLLCEGSDYFCDECNQHTCVCRDCVDGSKWGWRGMKGADNG